VSPRAKRRVPLRDGARLLAGIVAGALVEPHRPIMVFLTVTRRCNLSCGYCTEYDDTSDPVPLATLRERIDDLARLRTVIVTLNGGEPMLHPDLGEIVATIRARGMTATLNTNGFLLTAERILELNEAGLYAMQVSLDAVVPNALTRKALKTLRPKLELLAELAAFRVRINTVLGSAPPEETLEVIRAVLELGFEAKCALMRKPDGTPSELDARTRAIYDEIVQLEGRSLGVLGERFQGALLHDGRVEWKCRAGARFFHVCENGLVHLCGPRFGMPATPLATYGADEVRSAFQTEKACASTCPVAYAHMISRIDAWRPQRTSPTTPRRTHLPVVGA
jgi:MoaA/NifB/PqqE/SkfB family radical SAM enzyme